jgi:NitT/TauT family transport system substrate-binding protein
VNLRPFRIGVAFHSPFYTPLFVAHRLGSFREEGLDVTLTVPPPGGTVDLLEGGQVDLILSGVMRSFILAERGRTSIVAIAEVNSRDGFFILSRANVPPASPFSWRDLEGKRLALFGLAPTPWMCLQTAMREQGADPSAVRVVEKLDVAQGIEALRAGDVDYLQTGQPTAEALIADSVAQLAGAQASIVGHVPYSSFMVAKKLAQGRPELCAAAVLALTRALRWMATHDAEAITDVIAPEFPDVPRPIMTRAIARLHGAGTWASGPRQPRAPFQRLGRMLAAGGLIRTVAPYEALVDDSFAQAAATTLPA